MQMTDAQTAARNHPLSLARFSQPQMNRTHGGRSGSCNECRGHCKARSDASDRLDQHARGTVRDA